MLTRDQAKKLTEKALSYSEFPECEISLDNTEQAFIRYALNGITTSGYTVEQVMRISSTRDGKSGSTSVTEFDDASLRAAVKLTEQLAAIAPPNPERVEPLGPQKYPAIDNFDESTARARNQAMIPHVRAVIEAAGAKNLVAAGFFERYQNISAIANKQGNFGYSRSTDANLSTTVRTPEGTSSGWSSHPAVRIAEIDGAALGEVAVRKCMTWKNPVKLDPGKYTVVLEPTAVGDLVQLLGFNMQARSAEEGRSFLSKKGGGTLLAEKLFPETITLRSDPFDRRFPAQPWAQGGLPNAPVSWIDNGVVKNLWYDRYWAKKAGKEPTPFPNHLVLSGTEASLDNLIAGVENGLLVTRFWYIRFLNPQTVQLTGLTRDGLFRIESGKVTGPVVNFRFNESPVRLLQNSVKIGKPVRVRGGEGNGMVAPPMVVKDFPFTSISDAV
jgi:predicted Zn-dependent protease